MSAATVHNRSTYTNRGCRCDICRAAQNEYVRDYYARNLAHPRPIPPHGTESRYCSPRARCRCDECRAAATEAKRQRRKRVAA